MDDENFQKRIGKGMTIVGWIILLGLLTIYFNKYLDKQTNPNQQLSLIQNGEFKEIQLQRNRFGHYVANGSINNKTVIFILDTGATEISIPEKVARKLNLKAGISFPV
ncbi:MAG: retroviral-like aspartic protease family protein, partial [Proteobacteria bacterium]|nr:retroviral-like aspartic protease family protein [Pseudomonadota bacterium]